jgi:hypothetical protein
MGFQSLFANGASLHLLTSPTTGKLDYYNMLQNRLVEDEVTHMTVTTPLVDNIKIATGRPRSRHVHE